MNLFKPLSNYEAYLEEYPFHDNLKINLTEYGKLDKKVKRNIYDS